MESSSKFASVPISPSKDFSWVFIVDWVLILVLAVAIIFYFTRLTGATLSLLLRWTIWPTKNIRVDIQSVKFSILGGRVFFRNLTVVDKDQTLCVLQGSLTWRYWLPNVRRSSFMVGEGEDFNVDTNSKLPCRYLLELEGLEYFVYNRTVSYDNIMKALSEERGNQDDEDSTQDHQKDAYDIFSQSASEGSFAEADAQKPVGPSLLSGLFPLQIRVSKGAIVAGNKTTHGVLIVSFNSMNGDLDNRRAPSAFDYATQSFQLDIEKLTVQLKPNIFYEMSQEDSLMKPSISKKYGKKWKLFDKFVKMIGHLDRRMKKETEVWHGLAQYLDANAGSIGEFLLDEDIEYAKYTTILAAEKSHVHYFYDLPGVVPSDAPETDPLDGLDVGNGGAAPRYGFDMQLYSATIHAGPWVDRQRHSLQQMLMPSICRDGAPQKKLRTNQRRIYTNFSINIEAVDTLNLRIPIREMSKDEEFKKQNISNSVRPFGWIELKVSKGSTISLNSSFVASKSGYKNMLDISLLDLEVRSSVNHDIFLKCQKHSFSADIGFPLSWNGHTTWNLKNESIGVQTFLLREHITLVADLFSDFGSGDPTPYELFRPFTYVFDWKINDYQLFFNINDANIVNNPLDFNDNIYLSLQGDLINLSVTVPMDNIIRKSTTVDYAIETPGFSLILDTPPWHTLHNFLKVKEVGRSGNFAVTGSYTYYAEVGLDSVDTIVIACKGESVCLQCYGFVAKYIMGIRENYFGDFTTFKTLEEYTRYRDDPAVPKDIEGDHTAPNFKRIENETDVHFSFCVTDSCVVLPGHIYDSISNFSLPFETLDIDIRFTNYYMDMQVDSSPIKGYFLPQCDPNALLDLPNFNFNPESRDLLLDGLVIHGHRAFGLPPDEPTYFCKWSILPGNITFDGPIESLRSFVQSLVKFGFGYKNIENKLEIEEPELWDTTNLFITLPSIDIKLNEPDMKEQIQISLHTLIFRFIDNPNFRFSSKISLDCRLFSLKVLNTESSAILLDVNTAVRVTNFCLKKDYEEVKKKQDEHLLMHDGPFHRASFLIEDELRLQYDQLRGSIIPGFSLPNLNIPLTTETVDEVFDDLGVEFLGEDQTYESETQSSNDENKPNLKWSGKYWESITGANVESTVDYDIEDATPQLKGDPKYETDNLILNFGNIDVDVCLESATSILMMVEKCIEETFDSVLDNLHIAVLKRLNQKSKTNETCLHLRFVTPVINLRMCNKPWLDASHISEMEHMDLVLESPSLVLSKGLSSNGIVEILLALHVGSVGLSFHQSSTEEAAFELVLDDLEAWLQQSSELTLSLLLKGIHTSIQTTYLDWLITFIEMSVITMQRYHAQMSSIRQKWKSVEASLVHQIALASMRYNIEHDPPVITRPAYIIRLSKNHIRANDSWNIVVRLRHIFDNLPPEWRELQNRTSLDVPPDLAMADVLRVFRLWRSWEFEDIGNSFIFQYVFSARELQESVTAITCDFGIETCIARLVGDSSNDSFIQVSDINISSDEEKASTDGEIYTSRRALISFGNVQGIFHPLELKLEALEALSKSSLFCSSKAPDISSTATEEASEAHLVFSVEEVDLKVNLSHSLLHLQLNNAFSSTVSKKTSRNPFDLVINVRTEELLVAVVYQDKDILTYGVSDINVCSAAFNDGTSIECSSDLVSLNIPASAATVECFSLSLSEDIKLIEKMITLRQQKGISKPINNRPFTVLEFHLLNRKFNWEFHSLDLLKMSGANDSFETTFVVSGDDIAGSCSLLNSSFIVDAKMEERSVVTVISKKSSLNMSFAQLSNELQLSMSSDDFSLRLSEVIFATENICKYINTAFTNTYVLIEAIKQVTDLGSENKGQDSHVSQDLIIRELMVSNRFSTIGISMGGTVFSLDMNDLSLRYFDLVFGKNSAKIWPYGEMNVDSTQLNLKANDISLGCSSFVDFNFGMKIINDVSTGKRTLEVESGYSRVMLTPLSLVRFRSFVKNIDIAISKFKTVIPSKSHQIKEQLPKRTTTEIWEQLGFSSIHILSNNFCVGFIFDEPSEYSPGVIAGCDKVFAVTEGSLGKLTIIGAFFSLANGNNTNTFYSIGNEVSRPNRAYLPNVQVTYSIAHTETNKDVQINLTGEELDVKFITSSVLFVEQLIKSVAIMDSLTKHEFVLERDSSSQPSASQENYSLPSDVTSINFTMTYAGAIVRMTRWEDFTYEDDPYAPSFQLRAPAIKIVTNYSKSTGVKKHYLSFQVFTFSSTNVLHSTCVPVIYDVWETVRYVGKQDDLSSTSVERQEKQSAAIRADLNDFLKLFERIQLRFSLHIDKQEVTLSCEPSAKIQTVVGIESIDIYFGTNEDDDSYPLSGIARIGKIGASLQHSFSREVSGSVSIDEVLLTAMLCGKESFKLYTNSDFDTVKSYLYLKQLQDIDLFMDLWKFPNAPSSRNVHSLPMNLDNVSDELVIRKLQRVASTTLIPWEVYLLVKDLDFEIDLGYSLGVVDLNFDKIAVRSRRESDRQQDLMVVLDNVALKAEGRLSGHLNVEDLRIQTSIHWSVTGETYDAPSVQLSFGFGAVQIKASFDYNMFLISKVGKTFINVFNQIDEEKVLQDRLVARARCESIEVFLTSFAASNVVDVYNTLSRIRQDNKNSYKQYLDDEAVNISDASSGDNGILDILTGLRTELEVKLGSCLVHVYPGSLLDSQVLIVNIGGMNANFGQQMIERVDKLETNLKLHLEDINVSLSSFKSQPPEDRINSLTIDEFIANSRNAHGGNIFIFPSLKCSMTTFIKANSSDVEFVYRSSFGGKVDIRWNLGSIGFIREMWAIHVNALATRLPRDSKAVEATGADTEKIPLFLDEKIDQKIKDVTLGDKYKYVALEAPIIEAPQLKELGDATPPLEWFGLNRQNFPGLTHQLVIVGLQKLVKEVEAQYSHVLGKAR